MNEILSVDLFNGDVTTYVEKSMERHIIPRGWLRFNCNSRTTKRKIKKLRTMEDRKANDPFYGKPRHKNTNGFG